MGIIGFLILVVIYSAIKSAGRPRRVTFEVHSATNLRCGCLLMREEVRGTTRLKPCAAHQVMADSL